MTPAEHLRLVAESAWYDDMTRRDLRDLADDIEEATGTARTAYALHAHRLLLNAAPATDPTHPAWDEVWTWERIMEGGA